MKQGPFARTGLCCPGRRHYYDPLRLPLGCLPLPRTVISSRTPASADRAEEGLSSSHDTLVYVPRPLTPEGPSAPAPSSKTPSLAFADYEPARLPLSPVSRVADDAAGFT
jgi:hypothetical protein